MMKIWMTHKTCLHRCIDAFRLLHSTHSDSVRLVCWWLRLWCMPSFITRNEMMIFISSQMPIFQYIMIREIIPSSLLLPHSKWLHVVSVFVADAPLFLWRDFQITVFFSSSSFFLALLLRRRLLISWLSFLICRCCYHHCLVCVRNASFNSIRVDPFVVLTLNADGRAAPLITTFD